MSYKPLYCNTQANSLKKYSIFTRIKEMDFEDIVAHPTVILTERGVPGIFTLQNPYKPVHHKRVIVALIFIYIYWNAEK